MMQGFYLLARRRARLRAAAAAVFLLCAAVLAGAAVHASCAPEAVPRQQMRLLQARTACI